MVQIKFNSANPAIRNSYSTDKILGGSMDSKLFHKLAREILSPILIKPLGFRVKTREYNRILESGVVYLIGISKDPHSREIDWKQAGETFKDEYNRSKRETVDTLYSLSKAHTETPWIGD